ncbi:BMP family ABC transporter substrate-binding protein [Defluviimonas sp. SAOS-178_SWC]|uniref:BMP family ABC transporter substrate-binding protein n=1 Tax=Defluviimonas sp. SAOS-178_SWC TaxID=3121287 RepID=UPI003222171B
MLNSRMLCGACLLGAGIATIQATTANAADDTPVKIGLIMEARPEVEPWSLAWHDSVEAMKAQDSSLSVVETYDAYDATRSEPVIRQLIDTGGNVIALSTFVLTDVAKVLATDYPEVPMVLTSFNVIQQPNLSSATASYLEIGYATCWLLAKLSDDGRVGYIGAQKAPFEVESYEGCQLGAKAANPAAEVTLVNSNSFVDPQANREQTQSLVDKGITEIFLGSGTEDAVGGLRLCETVGAHCATWGGDGRKWAPTASVLTVVLDWSVVLDDLVKQARSGQLEAKQWDLTFGNGGLKVTDFSATDAVSDELASEFNEIVAGLGSLAIELPESKVHPGVR